MPMPKLCVMMVVVIEVVVGGTYLLKNIYKYKVKEGKAEAIFKSSNENFLPAHYEGHAETAEPSDPYTHHALLFESWDSSLMIIKQLMGDKSKFN